MSEKRAIIIGASSGIGRELAKVLAENGYLVGLASRNLELLSGLQKEIPTQTYARRMDLIHTGESMRILDELIKKMGGMDLIVISAATGFINPELDWSKEKVTVKTNVTGFTAMANVAYRYFTKQGSGHIVGISSIASLMPSADAPAYNATKAFMSNYLQGLRQNVQKLNLPITITEIQPGYVDTKMAISDRKFWMSTPQKAAQQIYQAIEKKKNHAYVTKRWRLIAWIIKLMPKGMFA